MPDAFDVMDWPHAITLTRRSDGGYANADGTWKAKVVTTVSIKAHLVFGPYEDPARTSDHILSGRAKQVGLVVERGEVVGWTKDDLRVGDRMEVTMNAAGTEKKVFLVTEEMGRPKLIEKLTGHRPGRKQFRARAEAP